MTARKIAENVKSLYPDIVVRSKGSGDDVELICASETVPSVCGSLVDDSACHFATLIVEELDEWRLAYVFCLEGAEERISVVTKSPLDKPEFKSVSVRVHAADWHEREAEDLFGLVFEGHPRLGDFILHDDVWQEGVEPMRRSFDSAGAIESREPRGDWRPRKIVDAPGSFIMPIGPVFSDHAESVHFQLETIGEEVLYAFPRLFFKYRGVEKLAEGRSVDEALPLVERFAGTAAFSHALAFSMAVEDAADVDAAPRAAALRVFFAELERFRSHLGTVNAICASTGLAVGASQTAILEERALRLSGALTGHRYLFGLVRPGGMTRDFDASELAAAAAEAEGILGELGKVEKLLINTSGFLDRLEEVGIIRESGAREHGLVGPVARASNFQLDLRRARPYAAYETCEFETPLESEGDGYARLRLWLAEAAQSVAIMKRVAENPPNGSVATDCPTGAGAALAGVETPRGAAWHWIRLDADGRIKRYRLSTPSFTNWHGFHLAAEKFAFQDFPIILATFGLSVAENDR